MKQYFGFWAAWVEFWAVPISFTLALYALAITNASQQIAEDFMKSSGNTSVLTRAIVITSDLTSKIFGERLISWKAFGIGMLLSGVVFFAAFFVAIVTSDGFGFGFKSCFPWFSNETPLVPHRIVTAVFVAQIIAVLSMEFLYVIKSRWFIRLIVPDMKWKFAITIFVVDLVSTTLLFSFLASLIIFFFGQIFLIASGSALNGNLMEVSNGYDSSSFFLRKTFYYYIEFKQIMIYVVDGIFSYLHGKVSIFYNIEVGSPSDVGCNFDFRSHKIVGCHSNSFKIVHTSFLFSSALVSAFATSMWMAIFVIPILIARIFQVPAEFFLWIHRNPMKILTRMTMPLVIFTLIGAVVVPVFHIFGE